MTSRVQRLALRDLLTVARGADRIDRHLLLQALQGELAEGLRDETADDAFERVLGDDDLAGLGHTALEAGSDVHGAAEDRVIDALLGADVTDDRRPAVDADADADD